MKNILLVIFSWISVFSYANQVVFSGTVENSNVGTVNILVQINDLTGEQIKYSAKINSENKFHLSIDITSPQIAYFEFTEQMVPFFVDPTSKNVAIHLDCSSANNYFFTGKNEADNNFYKRFIQNDLPHNFTESYEKGFLTTKIDSSIYAQAKGYMEVDYFQVIKDQFEYQKSSILAQRKISFPARQFFKKLAGWHYETNKFVYFLLNADRYKGQRLRNVWMKYQLLQDTDVNDDKYLSFPSYVNLLTSFIHYLNLETPVKGDGLDLDYYRFIDRNLSNKNKYFMMSLLMKNAYLNGESNIVLEKFKEFKRFNQYPELTTSLEDVFGGQMQFVSRKSIPDFDFVGMNGVKERLSMFEGKPVYISFWASWCTPCIQGFMATAEFRREMQNMGVVFLNVNLDKTEDIWRNTLPKYDIVGTNVYGQGLKAFQSVMKISSLPHHVMKDKYNRESFLSSEKLIECKTDFIKFLNE